MCVMKERNQLENVNSNNDIPDIHHPSDIEGDDVDSTFEPNDEPNEEPNDDDDKDSTYEPNDSPDICHRSDVEVDDTYEPNNSECSAFDATASVIVRKKVVVQRKMNDVDAHTKKCTQMLTLQTSG